MSEKNITISDVAEALGVSKTTVSRAISGKGRIGEATRKRVLEYIDNMIINQMLSQRVLPSQRLLIYALSCQEIMLLLTFRFFRRH